MNVQSEVTGYLHMLLTQQLSRHLMWWQCNMRLVSASSRLALKRDICFIILWAHFHYVFKTPAAISILSVAFSVMYSERNLAKSPYLSGIQFFGRGTLPPSMTFLIGVNVFVCHFLVSDLIESSLYLSKTTQIC